MEENLATFQRKFDMQLKLMVEEVGELVRHVGDRVIEAVSSGPHDRIRDPVSKICPYGVIYLISS